MKTTSILTVRVALDNNSAGWGYVRPGKRIRRHRRELAFAKRVFGLTGELGNRVWWLSINFKPGDLWAVQDCGIRLPNFIPLIDGEQTGDYPLMFFAKTSEGDDVRVRYIFRFPEEDFGVWSRQIPEFWAKGCRKG